MDIANHFGISPPSAHQMVVALEDRGLIARTPGQPRSIRVLVPPEELPRTEYGQPAKGKGAALESTYPFLLPWLARGGGIEFGRNEYRRSMVRALEDGGAVWEGKDNYATLDEMIIDVNEGLKQWFRDNK